MQRPHGHDIGSLVKEAIHAQKQQEMGARIRRDHLDSFLASEGTSIEDKWPRVAISEDWGGIAPQLTQKVSGEVIALPGLSLLLRRGVPRTASLYVEPLPA